MLKMKVTPQPLLKLVEVQLTFKSSILKSTDNKNFLLFPSGKNDITFQIIPVRNLELITNYQVHIHISREPLKGLCSITN